MNDESGDGEPAEVDDDELQPGDERWTFLPDGTIDVEYVEDPELEAVTAEYGESLKKPRR